MDRQTDNMLWHHPAVKIGRQNIADIIGIAKNTGILLI